MAAQKDNLSGWIWQHVTKVDDFIIRCNICKREYTNEKHAIHMKVHLYHVHKIYNEEDRLSWENNDLLRPYFSKKDLFTAKCKICDAIFHDVYDESQLKTHMKLHPQIMVSPLDQTINTREEVLEDHLNKEELEINVIRMTQQS